MKVHTPTPLVTLFLAFISGAAVLLAAFLWRAWRSGVLATWAIVGLVVLRGFAPLPAKRLFQEHIVDPIPKSVAEIKVDQPRVFDGYGYVFHFKIASADLDRIIGSRPFEKVLNVTYGGGGALYYGDWLSANLILYQPGEEPAWFIRRKLCGSEGYVYEEVKDRQQYTWVLLCNRELGEAYFFAFKGDA